MTPRPALIHRTIYRLVFNTLTPALLRGTGPWPICGGCGQSSTGMYGGKVRCVRCEPARVLR